MGYRAGAAGRWRNVDLLVRYLHNVCYVFSQDDVETTVWQNRNVPNGYTGKKDIHCAGSDVVKVLLAFE
jgi:hypothetical protein